MTLVSKPSSELESARLSELARLVGLGSSGVPGLLALLEERSWSMRREVIAALAALGDVALGALYTSLQHDRLNETRIAATVDTLVASSGDVETALISMPASNNPAVAADIAQILGRRRNPSSVPTLIGLLRHSDDNVAVAAIEALGRVGGRAAVDALVVEIERDYFFRTYPAIDVLGRSGDPRAIAPLARLLEKSQYLLEAARALGRTADKSAVRPLSALLVSLSDANVRVAALALVELLDKHRELYGSVTPIHESLRQTATETAVRRLSQTLVGADTAERIALCTVLGALRNEAAAPALARMLDGVPAVASVAANALRELGRSAIDQLRSALLEGDSARRQILLPLLAASGGATTEVVRCLDDADGTVRALACDALARMGDTSVIGALFLRLTDSNPRVVQAATAAIQSLGSVETAALAIDVARSKSPSARRAALRILSYFGYAEAIEVFSQAMHDADTRVSEAAITGLALIEHPRARVLLRESARDASERVRAAAMRGLGQSTPDADVIAALRAGLDDHDAWVRYYAAQALGKLNVQQAAEAIAALLTDAAGQVRVAAVEALSTLKCREALDALRAAAAADEQDVRRAALIGLGMMPTEESLPIVVAASRAPEAATRLVALSVLSRFESAEALAIVARAIADHDEGVRDAAIGLLSDWADPGATFALIGALANDALRARVLHALAKPAPGRIAGLLAALERSDEELAPLLTSVLGRVDPKDDTGALFEALRLPNVAARKAAAAMLAARGTREALAALKHQATNDPSDEVRRICALFLTQ